MDEVMLNVLRCQLTYQGKVVTSAEAQFKKSLRPWKPEGSLGRTAQDVHLDSHTAPELCRLGHWRGTLYLRAAVHRRGQRPLKGLGTNHTSSIAFQHIPPNSARFGYATEWALFIPAQLSTDAVSGLQKVWVLIKLQTVVYDILPSGGRCRKAVFGEWVLIWL